MSYEKVLQAKGFIVGTKQSAKSLKNGAVSELLVALDADPRLTSNIAALASKAGVSVTYVDSMKKLGKACGIQVGAAVVALFY